MIEVKSTAVSVKIHANSLPGLWLGWVGRCE